jgi:hypothetical protein
MSQTHGTCPVCRSSLSSFSENDQIFHINKCLDKQEVKIDEKSSKRTARPMLGERKRKRQKKATNLSPLSEKDDLRLALTLSATEFDSNLQPPPLPVSVDQVILPLLESEEECQPLTPHLPKTSLKHNAYAAFYFGVKFVDHGL